MCILTRLLGSKNRPTMTDGQPPSARSLMKARTPPWHKVAPIVIDAIFEEQLGHEDRNVSVIRAQISGILYQAGF
jgi:hypothetical protein